MSQQFLLEFINCLENEPALWQTKSDIYKNKNARNKSWEVLLNKYKNVDEHASIETVKKKVNSLRASYRRELHKIKRSEKSGAGTDDVYKPSIWYFDQLNFLQDQETSVDGINTFDDSFEIEIPKTTKRKRDEGAQFLQKAVEHLDNVKNIKTKDNADIFAEGWATMFRQLTKEQQLFAKKGIDELLMQGSMNMLTYSSVSSIENFQNNINCHAPVPVYPRQIIRVSTPLTSDSTSTSSFMSHYSVDDNSTRPVLITQNNNVAASSYNDLFNSDEYV
ncbi:uncharacterized protein LOC131802593 [Musca domestica]|uniref:Uncharacterized protein LOC131802593 n=1 Tax=Musca domestica TaxID=7370 RepID=A0ABM3UZF7_MUSDO|nr:uncharacterized protein LOC131802593 [Musca domestica]